MSDIITPMGGKVIDIKVKVGDSIREGDEVITIEAMKMELPIISEISGVVKEIKCAKGSNIEANAVLVILE